MDKTVLRSSAVTYDSNTTKYEQLRNYFGFILTMYSATQDLPDPLTALPMQYCPRAFGTWAIFP